MARSDEKDGLQPSEYDAAGQQPRAAGLPEPAVAGNHAAGCRRLSSSEGVFSAGGGVFRQKKPGEQSGDKDSGTGLLEEASGPVLVGFGLQHD